MGGKFSKYKWHNVVALAIAIPAVLILIAALLINTYWSPILATKVKDVVLKSSDSLYRVDFSAADLHVLRGTIVLFNITLKPDTAVYNRKKQQRLAPNNLVELHIKKLVLGHIHPFTLYFKKKLEIGEVMIYNPVLNVSYQLNHTRDTVVKDHRTPWQKLSKSLHSVHIGKILMGDVKLRYEDYSGNKLAISELKEMNLSAYDLLIDSATQTDRSRLLYCKDIVAELNNYQAKTSNGLYTYKINSLKLSTLKSRLDVQGLTLTPIKADAFFTKSHRDRFTVHLDSIRLDSFDFLSYHKYRVLSASALSLNNGGLQVFANPNTFESHQDRVISFPNSALASIKADINIRKIILNRVNVVYNEYNKQSNKTGSISFNNTSGTLMNITNNKAALAKNSRSMLSLTTYFMNRGKLKLTCGFNLTDSARSFTYKGSLGPMQLQSLNPAVIPLAIVKINSGQLKGFDFDINASRYGTRGKVTLLYNDLKVTLLKADSAMDKLKKKTLATMYANIFILKHNNPDNEGKQPRSFIVNYRRKPETAFFSLMWQTLLSGIKPSVGLDKKTETATAAMVKQQATNKQNRKLKKEQRKLRRAERERKKEERKEKK